ATSRRRTSSSASTAATTIGRPPWRDSKVSRRACAGAWDARCASGSHRTSPSGRTTASRAPRASRRCSPVSSRRPRPMPLARRTRTTRRAARPKDPTTAAEGLLLVDKPAGVSSHDVVAVARRALREKRIGHAGKLDPFATGLLILLLGRATRLMRYVQDEPKLYDAVIA